MAANRKNNVFKQPDPTPTRATKADQITETVRAIIADEAKRSTAKTTRLRELRLERDAQLAAEKAAQPAVVKKTRKKKAVEVEAVAEEPDTDETENESEEA